MLAITSRPRLVVYGRTPAQMLGPLLEAAQEIDERAEMDEEVMQVYLPRLRVRLRVAGHPGIDSVWIESFEPISASAILTPAL